MNTIKNNFVLVLLLTSFFGMAQNPHAASGLKKVIVEEILNVNSYTYLNVLEDGVKKWIVAPTVDAEIGKSYYYTGGMKMTNFESKELGRKFDAVYFVDSIISADFIDIGKGAKEPKLTEQATPTKKPTLEKLAITIDPITDGVKISELLKDKLLYANKKIKIKGEVTKFNSGIMGKNWVHFQDGTAYQGAYDLMITTQEILAVGDVIVFEGIISLNKDFGAGYLYKIIMEEASVLK